MVHMFCGGVFAYTQALNTKRMAGQVGDPKLPPACAVIKALPVHVSDPSRYWFMRSTTPRLYKSGAAGVSTRTQRTSSH